MDERYAVETTIPERLANIAYGYTHGSVLTEKRAWRLAVEIAIEVEGFIRRRVAEGESNA